MGRATVIRGSRRRTSIDESCSSVTEAASLRWKATRRKRTRVRRSQCCWSDVVGALKSTITGVSAPCGNTCESGRCSQSGGFGLHSALQA